jgi:hypothetical protein
MLIKLTACSKNETIYVNFDFVRTMRREGVITEITMSDDKYHKLAVTETPEAIYEMLYPAELCVSSHDCHCTDIESNCYVDKITLDTPTVVENKVSTKKSTAKKATAKVAE